MRDKLLVGKGFRVIDPAASAIVKMLKMLVSVDSEHIGSLFRIQ